MSQRDLNAIADHLSLRPPQAEGGSVVPARV